MCEAQILATWERDMRAFLDAQRADVFTAREVVSRSDSELYMNLTVRTRKRRR